MRRRTGMLRFASEEEMRREVGQRRERYATGQVATPEREILAGSLELLKHHPAVAFAHRQNTGSGYLLRADVYHRLVADGHLRRDEARFLRFSFPGCADILGMLRGGRFFAGECKSDRGQLSDDQQAFLDAVNTGGGLGVAIRSVSELAEALK